jgi:hypothetical protein
MLGEEDSAKAEEARASQANELPPSGPLAYVEAWDCLHCTTHAFNAHDLRAHLRTQYVQAAYALLHSMLTLP